MSYYLIMATLSKQVKLLDKQAELLAKQAKEIAYLKSAVLALQKPKRDLTHPSVVISALDFPEGTCAEIYLHKRGVHTVRQLLRHSPSTLEALGVTTRVIMQIEDALALKGLQLRKDR